MRKEEFFGKLGVFMYLQPIKILKQDGTETGMLILKNLILDDVKVSFTDNGVEEAIWYVDVKDVVPFNGQLMVVRKVG